MHTHSLMYQLSSFNLLKKKYKIKYHITEYSEYDRLGPSAALTARERTIRARIDTIRYKYSSVDNSRYRYNTSTTCVSVPATCIIRQGA